MSSFINPEMKNQKVDPYNGFFNKQPFEYLMKRKLSQKRIKEM